MDLVTVDATVLSELHSVYGTDADAYLANTSPIDKALAYLTLHLKDIEKTRITVGTKHVDVPNVFCDIFKSNIHSDLYSEEVANYAEVEYEMDIDDIKTEPEITGLVVGESIIDEFKVKRYGTLS